MSSCTPTAPACSIPPRLRRGRGRARHRRTSAAWAPCSRPSSTGAVPQATRPRASPVSPIWPDWRWRTTSPPGPQRRPWPPSFAPLARPRSSPAWSRRLVALPPAGEATARRGGGTVWPPEPRSWSSPARAPSPSFLAGTHIRARLRLRLRVPPRLRPLQSPRPRSPVRRPPVPAGSGRPSPSGTACSPPEPVASRSANETTWSSPATGPARAQPRLRSSARPPARSTSSRPGPGQGNGWRAGWSPPSRGRWDCARPESLLTGAHTSRP